MGNEQAIQQNQSQNPPPGRKVRNSNTAAIKDSNDNSDLAIGIGIAAVVGAVVGAGVMWAASDNATQGNFQSSSEEENLETTNIYVLELMQGKYYVGKSDVPRTRVLSHVQKQGSAWTRKYPPTKIIDIQPGCDNFDEDKITKQYMSVYGIHNVRGGSYCQMKLSNAQISLLQTEMNTAKDRCFYCGSEGHFQSQCLKKLADEEKKNPKKSITCFRCGRKGHCVADCYAKTHVTGQRL